MTYTTCICHITMFSRLPHEIIDNHIMPYAYNLQPKELLLDIKSWNTDINLIYYNYFTESARPFSKYNELILLNDLERFIKQNSDSLSNSNISSLLKIFLIDKTENMMRKIRLLIGLLTPRERTMFFNQFILEDLDD